MASSWSEENVNLNYFQHWRCQGVGMSCNFWTLMDIGMITKVGIRQMLLPFVVKVIPTLVLADVVAMLADVVAILVADVVATWLLADVIAICLLMVPYLADVIANMWLMLLPLVWQQSCHVGWCYCHYLLVGGTICAVVTAIVSSSMFSCMTL